MRVILRYKYIYIYDSYEMYIRFSFDWSSVTPLLRCNLSCPIDEWCILKWAFITTEISRFVLFLFIIITDKFCCLFVCFVDSHTHSYESMVRASYERRSTARMCCIRFCCRWNTDLCVWWNGWIWKIFQWTIWIASYQMGMEKIITKTARKWSTAVSASRSQFHKGWQ